MGKGFSSEEALALKRGNYKNSVRQKGHIPLLPWNLIPLITCIII